MSGLTDNIAADQIKAEMTILYNGEPTFISTPFIKQTLDMLYKLSYRVDKKKDLKSHLQIAVLLLYHMNRRVLQN